MYRMPINILQDFDHVTHMHVYDEVKKYKPPVAQGFLSGD
jgi:hypothetical protein